MRILTCQQYGIPSRSSGEQRSSRAGCKLIHSSSVLHRAMAIPGLQLPGLNLGAGRESVTPSFQGPLTTKTQSLAENTEYRFEVPFSRTVRIKLVTGTAELFGSELAQNRQYSFTGVKAAVYTYQGCILEIEGEPENDYVGEETEMVSVYNAHFALEDMRDAVGTHGSGTGPRVLVVGPDDAGKTTLIRTLTTYAVKMDRQPTVVNLDSREAILSVPGSLSATTFSDILDMEEIGGWGSSPISGPSAVPVKMPLVYNFGCRNPDDNKTMYKALITRLALAVTSRMQDDREVRQAGCFIDTPGSISIGKGGTYELIQHIISEFSVNVVAVIGSERLYQDMRRSFSSSSGLDEVVTVVRIPKSQGCVDRDEVFMRRYCHAQIRNYFFGSVAAPLSPHTQWANFDQITIYRIKTTTSSTAFDPGADDDYDPSAVGSSSSLQKEPPSAMLQNSLLAVTNASPGDSLEAIRDASILGYLYVAEVEDSKKRIRLLSPVSGRMPGNALLVGEWPEGIMDLMG